MNEAPEGSEFLIDLASSLLKGVKMTKAMVIAFLLDSLLPATLYLVSP